VSAEGKKKGKKKKKGGGAQDHRPKKKKKGGEELTTRDNFPMAFPGWTQKKKGKKKAGD